MGSIVFTIGHSTHSIDAFADLLKRHDVTALCDVRSAPYSRFNPQFNKAPLAQALAERGIRYVFLGRELGARSNDPSCYRDGRVHYDALAATETFKSGIERLRRGVERGYRMALMCAEKDPLDCHRTILVAQALEEEQFDIAHILEDGSLESHADAKRRLVARFKLSDDLFLSEAEASRKAMRLQGEKIAYARDDETRESLGRARA